MPFFLLGAPRSGTTIIRDVLREHPRLEAPEETFFYRWSEPFGTLEFSHRYRADAVIRKHREMDGISDSEFWQIYEGASSRAQLQNRYMALYLRKRGNPDGVWFDKTPQNVFGLFRLTGDFPSAPVFHIHRNPMDVTASIALGRSVGKQSLMGAVNIWRESVTAALMAKQVFPDRVYFISLERFIRQPLEVTKEIFRIVGVEVPARWLPETRVASDVSRYHQVFTRLEFDFIVRECGWLMGTLGYSTDVADYPKLLPVSPSHTFKPWSVHSEGGQVKKAAQP